MKHYYAAALLALALPGAAHAGDALVSYPAIVQALNTGQSVAVAIEIGRAHV